MSLVVSHRQAVLLAARSAPVRKSGWSEYIDLARAESLENRRCARRVRYQARDALGVIAFSAAASTLVTVIAALALSWAA